MLETITLFLEKRLRLRVNAEKSAVDRPWNRSYLGYSMTSNLEPRLKVAPDKVRRLKDKLKELFRRGRGRSLSRIIQELTPILRGWLQYFRLAQVKNVFEDLDAWVRRKLRCIIWRQWKRTFTRAKNLMKRGLTEERAWISATNGRGPWWNSGASHMNDAFHNQFFDNLGLFALLPQHLKFQSASRTAVYGTVRTVV